MTDKKTEALKLALEALENSRSLEPVDVQWVKGKRHTAITAIREALEDHTEQHLEMATEQPAQQPAAFKPFEIETSIEEGGEIHQMVTDLAGNVMLHVLDTQENDVRSALIEMGWTPPQLAQHHEPVAYMNQNGVIHPADYEWEGSGNILTPLYTSPPANANAGKPWVGLTKEERVDFTLSCGSYETVCSIEAKLKAKNSQ